MFERNRINKAKPVDVHFTIVDGQPCFERTLAIAWKGEGSNKEYDDKDLDRVAKHKFQIERFEQRQPEKKGMYEVYEHNGVYRLRFSPQVDSKDIYMELETILIHMGD